MPAVSHHQISLLQCRNYVASLDQICHGQNSLNITQVLYVSLPTRFFFGLFVAGHSITQPNRARFLEIKCQKFTMHQDHSIVSCKHPTMHILKQYH